MSKIASAFENRKAIVAFIPCGDPDFDTTAAVIANAAANGAGIIALGIPFSDPTAEGPLLQAASLRALSAGATTDKVFQMVREVRKEISLPMIFVTYANVVFSYGTDRFLSICQEIGMDGLLVPDLPYEEKEEFLPFCHKYGIDLISTIALNIEDRIAKIAKDAEGFLYVTSDAGADLTAVMEVVRKTTCLPCVADGNFSDSAGKIASLCDGIFLKEHLVSLMGTHGTEAAGPVGDSIAEIRPLFAKK